VEATGLAKAVGDGERPVMRVKKTPTARPRGVSSTRMGVSNTRMGVSNTHMGVSYNEGGGGGDRAGEGGWRRGERGGTVTTLPKPRYSFFSSLLLSSLQSNKPQTPRQVGQPGTAACRGGIGPGHRYSLDHYFTEMCSGSETGSYLRRIDF